MFRFKAKRRIGSRRIAGWPGPQREKKAQAPSEVPKSGCPDFSPSKKRTKMGKSARKSASLKCKKNYCIFWAFQDGFTFYVFFGRIFFY